MISLKRKYAFSLIGWGMLFFGLGWVVLDLILPVSIGYLTFIGTGIAAGGLAIVVITLRTIGKIDLEFEEI